MLIEEYERLPKLTEEEVRKQAEGIFNFLKLTHPYINNKKIFSQIWTSYRRTNKFSFCCNRNKSLEKRPK